MTNVLLALLTSTLGLPLINDTSSPGIVSQIQQFSSQFATAAAALLSSVDAAVVQIVRAAYITLLLLGVLLYFTHVNRRLGKDFMSGGVALIVIVEFVIPFVSRL